jgi:hypothetical protein
MTTRARTNNDLGTPAHILARVRMSFPSMLIACDPCSNMWSRDTVGAVTYFDIDEGRDGLLAPWHLFDVGGTFLNPPYSRGQLTKWSRKASAEAALHDCTTAWWQTMLSTCAARCDVHQRIPFVGGTHKTGHIKSEVFYHGPNPFLFAHAFDTLGEVIVYRRRSPA